MNLPNLITLARLVAVPAIVVLIVKDAYAAAFWLFLAAGVSDALDGILAKRFGMETVLGSYLDPIADKALLMSTYVALAVDGHLPLWLAVLVVFRDVVIIGGAILYETLTGRLEMRPLMVSKVNTAMQIGLAVMALASAAFRLDWSGGVEVMGQVVAVTTVASGGAYLYVWGRRAAEIEDARGRKRAPGE